MRTILSLAASPPLALLTALSGCHWVLPLAEHRPGSATDIQPVEDTAARDHGVRESAWHDLPRPDAGRPDADQPDALPPGLVAWYRLDTDPGVAGQARDSSGNARHGSCAPAATCPKLVAGKIGQAHQFDGIDDAFFVADDPAFHPAQLTLALWINVAVYEGGSPLSKPLGTAKLNSWQLEIRTDGQVSFTTSDGSNTAFMWTGTAVPTGQWVHLAATWDGVAKQLYVDGKLVNSDNRGLIYDTQGVVIGADRNNGQTSWYFNGAVDDIRIYDRVLNATELVALANP